MEHRTGIGSFQALVENHDASGFWKRRLHDVWEFLGLEEAVHAHYYWGPE